MDHEQRLEYLLTIPWITEIPDWQRKNLTCERNMYKRRWGNCKQKAHFRYVASRRNDMGYDAKTQNVCWFHAVANLNDHDYYRYREWNQNHAND